jgi:hypothetical protein
VTRQDSAVARLSDAAIPRGGGWLPTTSRSVARLQPAGRSDRNLDIRCIASDGEPARPECRDQAIAKAEAVTGNAARLVSTPTLCLRIRRDRRALAAWMLLVRRGRLLSAGGDARRSRETGCAPTEAGAAAERAAETRSRPLVTTVRWSRGTACESRLRVREVRAPAGEDVARVADVAGVERLVAPGDVGARVGVVRDERAP